MSEEKLREEIRRKISAILMDTDEDNQLKCEIIIETSDSCGLSSLEMPAIDSCYQEPCEGRIWFHFVGHYENIETMEKEYTNFDDIPTDDLKVILESLLQP